MFPHTRLFEPSRRVPRNLGTLLLDATGSEVSLVKDDGEEFEEFGVGAGEGVDGPGTEEGDKVLQLGAGRVPSEGDDLPRAMRRIVVS